MPPPRPRRRPEERFAPLAEITAIVERFNLRRVYQSLFLAGVVGVVAGVGALAFKWLSDHAVSVFWGLIISHAPATAGGEPSGLVVHGPIRLVGLVIAPALGGLLSALIVYRFAPEAAGHGTDAAIRAYHRERGRIKPHIPIVKLLASALTLGSGGSAGREGPIAQIGAGFGSLLGKLLGLSDRQRGVLLAAGMSAGIGAIFRAPFAGAIFAAEVLYREPDMEAEVVVPALLSAIVSYSVYCAVHGFGHLFTGAFGFTFHDPRALLCYVVLGLVTAFGGIAYVTVLERITGMFRSWRITNYVKPAIGGAIVGTIGLVAYLIARDESTLGVMGSGYGVLQRAVDEWGDAGPTLAILAFVAVGKMVTTAFTIGSGGSGGVFGPSMVIGGCLGAAVGTVFHAWIPDVVSSVGPFTIVGMAGFFAGVAKTPISTLLMVGELTGNYALLLPSMLAVCLSMIITHRWTIYSEQVPTRADSPVHRSELLRDVFSDMTVASVFDRSRPSVTIGPEVTLSTLVALGATASQPVLPILSGTGAVLGVVNLDHARRLLAAEPPPANVRALDLVAGSPPTVALDDSIQRVLDLLELQHVEQLTVISETGDYLGLLDRRDLISAYRRRVGESAAA